MLQLRIIHYIIISILCGLIFPAVDIKPNTDSLAIGRKQKLVHFSGHLLLPAAIAYAGYGSSWKNVALLMTGANLVDVDHLLAKPIYDPDRCSIGTHPLHSIPAIGLYSAMALHQSTQDLGVGLLTHMAVDYVDCINTKDRLGTLKYPKIYRDPVNVYSLSHLFIWYGMAQFSEVEVQHMLGLSLGWELIELYLPFEFARESYLNKFCDIFFNSLGFYMGKRNFTH